MRRLKSLMKNRRNQDQNQNLIPNNNRSYYGR